MKIEVSKVAFNQILQEESLTKVLSWLNMKTDMDFRRALYKQFNLSIEEEIPGGLIIDNSYYTGTAEQNVLLRKTIIDNLVVKR